MSRDQTVQTYGQRAAARLGASDSDTVVVSPSLPASPMVRAPFAAHFFSLYLAIFVIVAWYPGMQRARVLMTLGTLAVWGVMMMASGRPLRSSRFLNWFTLWTVWTAVTLLMVGISPIGHNQFKRQILVLVVMWMAHQNYRLEASVRVLIVLMVLSVVPLTMFNRADILRAAQGYPQGGMVEERLTGTMGNANVFGMHAATIAWLAMMLAAYVKKWGRKFWWTFVPVSAYLALLSGSRKAMIAIALLPAMRVLLLAAQKDGEKGRMARRVALLFLAGVTTYAAFHLVIASPFGMRFDELQEQGLQASAGGRRELGLAAIRMWLDNPILGVGFDRYRFLSVPYGGVWGQYSHSTPLELLSCTGVVGFAIYVVAFYFLGAEIWGARKLASGVELILVNTFLGVFALFTLFMVFAVLHDSWSFLPLMSAASAYCTTIVARHRRGRT